MHDTQGNVAACQVQHPVGQIDDAHEAEYQRQTDGNDKEPSCIGYAVKEYKEIVAPQSSISFCTGISIYYTLFPFAAAELKNRWI